VSDLRPMQQCRPETAVFEDRGADTGAERHHDLDAAAGDHIEALEVGVVEHTRWALQRLFERTGEIEVVPRVHELGVDARAGAVDGDEVWRAEHESFAHDTGKPGRDAVERGERRDKLAQRVDESIGRAGVLGRCAHSVVQHAPRGVERGSF
jgi:hypothetical protein